MIVSNVKDYGNVPEKFLKLKDQGDFLVAKYSKKAFYQQAWLEYPVLSQARGHVFDAKTGDIVARPFDKVFNYTENSAGSTLADTDLVTAVRKINGFLGHITILDSGKLLYGTTGSVWTPGMDETDNDFLRMLIAMSRDFVNEVDVLSLTGETWLFEVCHPNDPHIIQEETGLYLIGLRDIRSGHLIHEDELDLVAGSYMLKRAPSFETTFGELRKMLACAKHEGFMVLDSISSRPICKLKSPYYLQSKFLARAGSHKFDETFDEEIQNLLEKLPISIAEFKLLDEQTRLEYIRNIM